MSKKILVILPLIVALILGLVAYTSPVQSQPYYELTFTLKDQLGYPLKDVDVAIVIVNKTCPCALAVGFGTTDSEGKVTIPTVPGLPDTTSVATDWNITILIKSVDRWGDQWFLFHHSEGTFPAGKNWVDEFDGAVVYGEYFVNLRFIAHTDIDEDGNDAPLTVDEDTESVEPGINDWFDEVPVFIDNNGNPMGSVKVEVWIDPAGAGFTKVWSSGIDEKGYTGYFNVSTVKVDFNYRPTIDPMLLITDVWNTTLIKYEYWIPTDTNCEVLVGNETIEFDIRHVYPNNMPNAHEWLWLTSEQSPDFPLCLPADPWGIFTSYSVNVTHVFADTLHPDLGPAFEYMKMYVFEEYPPAVFAPTGLVPWNHGSTDHTFLPPDGSAVWIEDFLYFEFPFVKLYDHEWKPVWSGATQVKAFFELDNCIIGEGQATWEDDSGYDDYLDDYREAGAFPDDLWRQIDSGYDENGDDISHFPEAGWMGSLNTTMGEEITKDDSENAPFFVLPFTELTLGKKYELEIVWENVLIFSRPVSINFSKNLDWPPFIFDDHVTPFWFLDATYNSRNGRLNVRTSIMKVSILVKDSEPVPQPVGSSVSTTHLRAWLRGPTQIVTSVDEFGYVLLPPYYWNLPSPYPVGGPPIYYPCGYLPIPWNVSQDNTDVCWDSFYYLKFEWAGTPEAITDGEYVDVTIYDPPDYRDLNTVSCPCYPPWYYHYGVSGAWHYGNSTLEVQFCCDANITVYVKLYQVKFQALSLCNDPLYPNADQEITETKVVLEGPDPTYYELSDPHDPDAKLYIWWYDPETGHEKLIAETTLQEPNGTTPLEKLVEGSYKVLLFWKGCFLQPLNITTLEPINLINVSGNINCAMQLYFPVRNVRWQITQWDDCTKPLIGVNVTILYPETYTDPVWGVKRVYAKMEQWQLTNKTGWVEFKLVPACCNITVLVATTEETPYIRPKDINKVIFFDEIHVPIEECEWITSFPVWVYSFTLEARTHDGSAILESIEVDGITDITYYNVTVVLDDTYYMCMITPFGTVLADYRIINISWVGDPALESYKPWFYDPVNGTTDKKAIYEFTSEQSDAHPHLFIAGADYLFKVYHGGVLVYNFTVTLPRPDIDKTGFINETCTNLTTWTIEHYWTTDEIRSHFNYTWPAEHPIWRMKGVPACTKPTLELLTWTLPLKIYPVSNPCETVSVYAVPNVKLVLTRNDTLSPYFVDEADYFTDLTDDDETTWSNWGPTAYSWSSFGEEGEILIYVPVWIKRIINGCVDAPHEGTWKDLSTWGVKFGANITKIELLGSGDWNTPGIETGTTVVLNKLGITNVSYASEWEDPTSWDEKIDEVERAFKSTGIWWGFDAGWNLTWWTGSWKWCPTELIEEKTLIVKVYDPYTKTYIQVPSEERPYPHYNVTVVSDWDLLVAQKVLTKDDNELVISPDVAKTISTPNGTSLLLVDETTTKALWKRIYEYNFMAEPDFTWKLNEYGITGDDKDYFDIPVFDTGFMILTEDENCATNVIYIKYYLLPVIEDWSEKPLPNMTVMAYRMGSPKPIWFDISSKDGVAILYVPDTGQYELKVYWRDSIFLYWAKAIPKYIDIYASRQDETDMLAKYWNVITHQSGTVRTYVFIGQLKLNKVDGSKLSPESLSKITVKVTWPDKVVAQYTPMSDGTVPVILNEKTNVLSWPLPVSANYNPNSDRPQTPAGEYRIQVFWSGISEPIYDANVTIERSAVTTPEKVINVNLDVRDFTVVVQSFFGTPLKGASVELTKADGTKVTDSLDTEGKIKVFDAPLGKVTVKVVSISPFGTVDHDLGTITAGHGETVTVVDENFAKLVVKVTGARGQGLEGADVTVKMDGTTIATGTTGPDGTFTVEVVSGKTYSAEATYAGKTAKPKTATVTPGAKETVTYEMSVDVWIEIAGWAMDFGTFIGLILMIVLAIILLFILLHEYSVWRRKRALGKVVVQAKPGQ